MTPSTQQVLVKEPISERRTTCEATRQVQTPASRVTPRVFQYGADVRALDHDGRNALWYARSSRSGDCVELLRAQGCPDTGPPPPPPGAPGSGATLPRRRTPSSQDPPLPPTIPPPNDAFEKLPASVI